MSLNIYHQVGHNDNWNVDSLTNDHCGDGLILSPVHQNKERVEALGETIKQRSIFDPQFYLPNSQKRKLSSYPFFPETIANGFSTIDFPLVALDSAKRCVAFQIEQGFEKIIIPARFIDQMVTDYIERQEEYSVLPFLKAIEETGTDKQVFVTLPLTSHMIEDVGFRTNILNWVTGLNDITGVYLLVANERDTKQIQSREFLSAYLEFLMALRNVDLEIIVGHCNTESLLFSLVGDITLTYGTFENTRMFSIDKFIESEEERRGPKARMYLPGLLNWVLFSHAKEIMNDAPPIWERIYRPTEYGDATLKAKVEPYFNQPALYKHHFLCFSEQINILAAEPQVGRYDTLREWIRLAIQNHADVAGMHIDLDRHGNGDHLQPWLDTINTFYRRHLMA